MKKILIFITLILAAAVNGFAQTADTAKKPLDLKNDLIGLENQAAPMFSSLAMDGNSYDLAKLKGKIVLINLWGTFCPPCVDEIPDLNALVEKYASKDIVFLAPAPDEKSVLESFLQTTKFDYHVLPNAFNIVQQYAPKKKGAPVGTGFMMLLPTHLVIDQNGIITKHFWGFSKDTAKNLSAEIDRLLEKSAADSK